MSDSTAISRRRFLEVAGSAALAASLLRDGAPAVAAVGRPNVVLIVIDTLRSDHVSAYGGGAYTPNIDSLAGRGLRFARAYPEAMATVPARRSIMTGRRVFPFRHWHVYDGLRHTPGWAPIADPANTVFTSLMRRSGYWTSYVTDNPFLGFARLYGPFRHTFDRFVGIGGQLGQNKPLSTVSRHELNHWLVPELRRSNIERRVRHYLANGDRYWRDDSRSWAARVSTTGALALDEAARHQPFALVLDAYQPHEPWTPPRHYIDMYGDKRHRGPEPSVGRYGRVSDWLGRRRAGPVLSRMRDLYAAEVTMTDAWLGRFLGRLRQLGLERSTVIMLVADHGYLLGDYGWTGKIASSLHPALIQVPLILVDPSGRQAGGTSGYFASTHDIGPTLLTMAGIPRPPEMDGVDLSPLLSGGQPARRRLAWGGYANWFYVRTDDWALISDDGGNHPRLYDLHRDPRERHNVARRHPRRVRDLTRAVRRRAGGKLPVYR